MRVIRVEDQPKGDGTGRCNRIVVAFHILRLVDRAGHQIGCAVREIRSCLVAAFADLEGQIGGIDAPGFCIDCIAPHEDLVLVAVLVVKPEPQVECAAGCH